MSSIRNRSTQPHLLVLEDRTAPALLLDFATSTSIALSPTEAPDSWYPDRYAPAGFTSGQSGGGRVGVLDEFISAADKNGSRPDGFNTNGFYDFQGRKYDLDAGTTYVAADLYVPASWSGLNQQDPSDTYKPDVGSLASLWATGTGGANKYPIIAFNNLAGSGTGGFQVFAGGAGRTSRASPAPTSGIRSAFASTPGRSITSSMASWFTWTPPPPIRPPSAA